MGRLIFDCNMCHLSNISIEVKNIKLIINKLVKKDLCLKFKYRSDQHKTESDFTLPLEAVTNVNTKQTVYNWINTDEDKLILNLQDFALHSLSSTVVSLMVYDTKLEKKDPDLNFLSSDKLSKFTKKNNDEYFGYKITDLLTSSQLNLQDLINDNNNNMTKQSSKIFKSASAFHKPSGEKGLNLSRSQEVIANVAKDDFFIDNGKDESCPIIKFQIFDTVEKVFCEEIKSDEGNIGTIEGRAIVMNIPLIKQIICGVHTERGFDIGSHYLTYNEENQNSFNNKEMLKEVKSLSNEINRVTSLLTESVALKINKGEDLNKDILNNLKEINKILLQSSKDSVLYFNYHNRDEILFAQETMIKFGISLIGIIDNMKVDHGKEAYKIILTLMNRAEFDLGSMSINIDDSNDDTLLRRVLLCHNFIDFLNQCLSYCLDKFAKKVIDKDIQAFIEHTLSVCYFRIPKFREAFLEAISLNCDFNLKSNNKTNEYKSSFNYNYMKKYCINEHEHLNYFEDIKQKDDDYINPIVSTIDWDDLFYKKLNPLLDKLKKNQKQSEITKQQSFTSGVDLNSYDGIIDKIDIDLKVNEWRERLSRRNLGFLTVIKKLEDYIRSKIIVNRDINWEDIPGFDIIIFSIMNELKSREVSKYPKLLTEVMLCFINNVAIINLFVLVIARKTNIHDTNAVFKFFEILNDFFQASEIKISSLKTTFDYSLLKQCFMIIFEADHSLSVAKLLWFLYENCNLFEEENMADIFSDLLNKKFFKYFFHWSYQVRHVFYNLILFALRHKLGKSQKSNRRQPQQTTYISISQNSQPESPLIHSIHESIRERLLEINSIMKVIDTFQLSISFKNRITSEDLLSRVSEGITIPKECYEYLVISCFHFKSVEKDYDLWLENIKKKKLIIYEYPDMTISKLKDDVIDYAESWS